MTLKKYMLLAATLLVFAAALYWLFSSFLLRADTNTTASFQAEAGTKSGSTTTITDTAAANGSAVQFGSAATSSGTWWSGQSNATTTKDGSFAAWRERSVEIAGNWASTASESDSISAAWWEVGAGDPQHSSYANIPRVDYAIGAMIDNSGETWAQAATGAYDARWAQQLQQLKGAWANRLPSNMYIRFAHEFNGNWYPWKVAPSDITNFKNAWIRFKNLRDQHFPGAQIVWCPNEQSSYSYSISELYPGDTYVDVVAIDSYNWWPFVTTQAEWNSKITRTQNGGPGGLESYRQFAQLHGKPFAISEWSNVGINTGGGGGESPQFMEYFYSWLQANGSQTPASGKVLYEIVFNITGYNEHFSLFPLDLETGNTTTAQRYKELW